MINSNNLVIKTVIDNTAATPFMMAEWGLSIYIDTGDKKILFDTGAGHEGLLINNLDALGISVLDVDTIVLSHGHQDHTGGLRPFFKKMHDLDPKKQVEIVCHPAAVVPQYVKNIGSFGCPYTMEELIRFGAIFKFITTPYQITEDIIVSGEVAMTNDYESTGKAFFRELGSKYATSEEVVDEKELGFFTGGKQFVQDMEVIDDMAIYLKTDLGPVVILGCAHRGTINTLKHAADTLSADSVYMVIGGTHTAGVSDERMQATLDALRDIGIKKVGVSHCTGQVAATILSNNLGKEIFFHNNAGSVIQFNQGEMKVNEF